MFYVLLFCLIGTSLCQFQQVLDLAEDNWEPESPAAKFLGLASGASKVVPHIKTSFSCIGRRYGYFADVDNNCQIFHICHPSVDAKGAPVIYHYSKFCPKHTRFDQVQLTCVSETSPKILPCVDSLRFYAVAESRFDNIPVIQKGFEYLPQVIEQREELIPFEQVKQEILPVKNIHTFSNVAIPTKNLVRTVIAQPVVHQPVVQPVVQSVVHQPLVTQSVVHQPIVAQRKLIQQKVVSKHVSPVVSYLTKQINIPSTVYGGLPIQTIQSQVVPSFLTVPQQQIVSLQQPVVERKDVNIIETPVQTIPKSLLTLEAQVDQKPIVSSVEQKQTLSVEQPIAQSVSQAQAFSISQSGVGAEGVFPQTLTTSEQQSGQLLGQSVQQFSSVQESGILQKEEGIVERPSQTIPSAVE